MEWIILAGLCGVAHCGEGSGNRFLATIREFLPYVMWCVFPGGSGTTTGETTIHHIEGVVDPMADAQVVNLELLLADLEHMQRRLEKKDWNVKH